MVDGSERSAAGVAEETKVIGKPQAYITAARVDGMS